MTISIKQLGFTAFTSSAIVLATANLSQALTVFSDRTSFLNATTNQTNIDFEKLAPIGSFTSYSPGLSQSSVSFSGSNSYLYVVDPGYTSEYYNWGSGAVLLGEQLGTITADLPSGIKAVGSDISSILNYASDFTIKLSTGESFTVGSSSYPNRAFVGFIADSAISSISFTAKSGYTELDNFVFGQAKPTAVPTPALLPGLIGLSVGILRKRKAEAAKQTSEV